EFITAPPRTRPRRIAEASATAGCLALLAATALHDQLWSAISTGTLTTLELETLTLAAGMATALATATVLLATTERAARR
ncbi:MAG TPA: hypothetical protein VH372_01250, partial [Actinospica sp.]|nr:hypothetical protein [Actinospica sp.]